MDELLNTAEPNSAPGEGCANLTTNSPRYQSKLYHLQLASLAFTKLVR